MAIQYTRQQVFDRLRAQIKADKPLIGVGAGTGISAKFAERGGADLIIIYNSGRYRMAGFGSLAGLLAFGNANEIVLEMGEREVLPVVKETPVIAGVNAVDPTMQIDRFLVKLKEAGFSGINNFPTVGIIDGSFRQGLEETGMGFDKEVQMIRWCQDLDFFTIVYCFTPQEAAAMAEAGSDCIIAHAGLTTGGSIGASQVAISLERAAELCQEIFAGAKKVRSDILLVSHGGPIEGPKEAAYINEHTDAMGFIGASSIERLATEGAIQKRTAEFKQIPVRRKN